jgi:hypothetical protein
MKAPRFRISWLMGCVALVALNFGVMRLLDDLGHREFARTHTDRFLHVTQNWVVGGLPMLNTLGIVLVIGLRRRGSHGFVWGFVLFGAIALALYVAAVGFYFDEFEQAARDLLRPIVVALTDGQMVLSAERFLLLIFIAAATFFLPQLAVALIGGFLFLLFQNFKIRVVVERRDHSPADGLSSY